MFTYAFKYKVLNDNRLACAVMADLCIHLYECAYT